MADPDRHWFPWLENELSTPRIHVEIQALPDSSSPDLNAWEAAAAESLGDPDDDLVIVGHSLGGITALKALDARPGDWSLGGLIMVSGFDIDVPTLPELTAFTGGTPDFLQLTNRVRARFAISSDHDEIVPPEFTKTFARHLDASLTTVPAEVISSIRRIPGSPHRRWPHQESPPGLSWHKSVT